MLRIFLELEHYPYGYVERIAGGTYFLLRDKG